MNNSADGRPISIDAETLTYKDGWPCFREKSLLEGAVTEAARELQVSREMAMMCAFGAMATACQGHVNVQMPTGHQVPTSLMLLTIAGSGERKTTTQEYFFETINELNAAAHSKNVTALADYRTKLDIWKMKKRHLESTYRKIASKGDDIATQAVCEAIVELAGAEPQPARSGKFLYDDTTPQALVQMLYENTSNGCLLTSEASSIFSGKALGELDKLNTLWDGGRVIVDRVSRESFILKDARLTLSLMAQPSVIDDFMGKRGEEARGTGFLARFLVTEPRSMAGKRSDSTQSKMPRQHAFNYRIREHLDSDAAPTPQVLHFSESAAELWYRYSRDLETQMQENGFYYYLKDHASKLLENATRLAAILHTFERTSNIDSEIDTLTLKFSWEFAKICSKHFIEHLAKEPQLVSDTNLLANYLLKDAYKKIDITNEFHISRSSGQPNRFNSGAKTTFTLTQVKQLGPGGLRGRVNSQRLEAAVDLLTRLGHISKVGSQYNFQETILLRKGEPQLKNGETVTIKALPKFADQEYSMPRGQSGYGQLAGYVYKD